MKHHDSFTFTEILKLRKTTRYFILHHSGVSSPHTPADIHQWHLNKGWAGIGYHFIIDPDGKIHVGRPIYCVGAHTYGYNHESIGICLEGDFNKEQPTEAQIKATVTLLYRLGHLYPNAKICRHSDFNKSKNCPGKFFPFEKLKQQIS